MFLSEVGVITFERSSKRACDSNRSGLVPIKNKGLTNNDALPVIAKSDASKRCTFVPSPRDEEQSRLYTNRLYHFILHFKTRKSLVVMIGIFCKIFGKNE